MASLLLSCLRAQIFGRCEIQLNAACCLLPVRLDKINKNRFK
jgi:hypothetical protein